MTIAIISKDSGDTHIAIIADYSNSVLIIAIIQIIHKACITHVPHPNCIGALIQSWKREGEREGGLQLKNILVLKSATTQKHFGFKKKCCFSWNENLERIGMIDL